jgi:tetratricopeptide (TPR) repeat protein
VKELRKLLREALPEIIGGLVVAAVTSTISTRFLGISIWTAVIFAAGCTWLCCAYLAFKLERPIPQKRRRKKLTKREWFCQYFRWRSWAICGRENWKYSHLRPWALAGLAIIPILVSSGLGYHIFQRAQPPDKVIILVADFDGPDPQKYRVTETVLNNLSSVLEPYNKEVQVKALGRTIKENEIDEETGRMGSDAARTEGERDKATIVVWGWYGSTLETVPLSVNFEMLRPPSSFPELGPEVKGLVRLSAIAELESFSLQTKLSAEMAYLSLFTVGMACYAAEDWDEALDLFNDALSQTDETASALDESIVYMQRGRTYLRKGEYDKAIADFNQVNDSDAQNLRAIAYLYMGEYDRLIADYDQIIELEPENFQAYILRGIAHGGKGQYDQAIDNYNEALRLQPNDPGAYANRGVAYLGKGSYDKALLDFNEVIESGSADAYAYVNRGIAYGMSGEYRLAIADFNKAIKLKPDFPAAYDHRGIAYGFMGKYKRSIADFDKAISLDPDYAKAFYDRGVTYDLMMGEYERGIADYGDAIRLKPDYVNAYLNRAGAYYMKGDSVRAIDDYKKVLELSDDPHDRRLAEDMLESLGAK